MAVAILIKLYSHYISQAHNPSKAIKSRDVMMQGGTDGSTLVKSEVRAHAFDSIVFITGSWAFR